MAKGGYFVVQAVVSQNHPKDIGAFSSTTTVDLLCNGQQVGGAAIQRVVEADAPDTVFAVANLVMLHGNDGALYVNGWTDPSLTGALSNTPFFSVIDDTALGLPSVVDPTVIGWVDYSAFINPAVLQLWQCRVSWDATGGDAGFINRLIGFSLWALQPSSGNTTAY